MEDYFDQDLMVSFQIPKDWQPTTHQFYKLVVLAPSHDGYQSRIAFNAAQMDETAEDYLDAVFEQSYQDELKNYNNYKLIEKSRKVEIDGNPGRLRHFEWQAKNTDVTLVQLQGAVLLDSGLLYVILGSCLKKTEAKDLPLLQAIIDSMRFIPAQTQS